MTVTLRARTLNVFLISWHVYFGAGLAVGSPRLFSARGFTYASQLLSQHAWGWLLISGAACTVACPWVHEVPSAVLHVLAALPVLAMAATLALAEAASLTQSWGGAVLWTVPITVHALLVVGRRRHVAAHGEPRRA